jgi:hypothetical protein
MSTIFLAIACAREKRTKLFDAIEPLVPILPERCDEATSIHGKIELRAWTVNASLARGSRFHKDQKTGAVSCFDGWILEDEVESVSLGEALSRRFVRMRFPDGTRQLDGNWAALHLGADGKLWAATDRMNTHQLYYGERGGVVAVSNRATLVCAALHDGKLPTPESTYFAWWMSANMSHVLQDDLPWPGVAALDPRKLLVVEGNTSRQVERSEVYPHVSWDEARGAFAKRCAWFNRLPGIDGQLALTGGKDSRAVLAGLIMADAIDDRLARAYLMSTPGNPDAAVAQRLANHYDIPFENDGIEIALEGHLFDRMQKHLWRTEGLLHSWDIKWMSPPSDRVTLNGHFGESYRSHFERNLVRPWNVAARRFTHDRFIDQHDLLTPSMRVMVRGRMGHWLEKVRGEGVKAIELRDTWHRQCRMWKWASLIQLGDGLGGMVSNPLASGALLAGYKEQGLRSQQLEVTHFELIRGADDWLWRQPFANATWQKGLAPRMKRLPPAALTMDLWPQHSRQHEDWRRHKEDAVSLLREGDGVDHFYDVFEREGVERLLSRYEASPDGFVLKALFGLIGARIAMRGIAPVR